MNPSNGGEVGNGSSNPQTTHSAFSSVSRNEEDSIGHYLAISMTPGRGPRVQSDGYGEINEPPVQQHIQQNHSIGNAPPGNGLTSLPTEEHYLWGTGISPVLFKERFRRFLDRYRRTKGFEDCLRRAHLCDMKQLDIDFGALREIDEELYIQAVSSPAECLRMISNVIEELFAGILQQIRGGNENTEEESIKVAPRNLPFSVSLRELAPLHIETLIAIRGLVVRTSKIIPEVRVAHFECWACKNTERSVVERGRIFEPTRCNHCGKQYSYQLVHNLCIFEDKQLIRIQEAPENLADGETPVTISCIVYGELVDAVVPGDRVVVTGIYRAAPMKLNANTRIVKSVFKTHLDAVHIDKSSRSSKFSGSTDNDFDFSDLTKVDQLRAISRRQDVYQLLLRSLAPTIWGHEDVKKGILCQMFGGSRKNFGHGKFRSELNIILCGDPGVAKSQLLTQVHAISPRGVYTSGKGSSSVGLTAFVVRDADTGEFVLEPGALVLSDRGVCCIDEFDKMSEETRSVLHEVMEQQTLSIAKAGIIAQLNARTSILAAANPKESQWNPTMNIIENLQIEPALLSRFDLIYLLLDKQDEMLDRLLAGHVLGMYMDSRELQDAAKKKLEEASRDQDNSSILTYNTTGTVNTATGANNGVSGRPSIGSTSRSGPLDDILDRRLFSQYIAYAKEMITPVLTVDAHETLVKSYVSLRKGREGGKTVTATLRQLESMIRIAEANAKMRLSTEVLESDVLEAKRLISEALKDAATDPRTGMINMEMFAAPDLSRVTTESILIRLERLIETKYMSAGKRTVSVYELRSSLQGEKPISAQQFMDVLAMMTDGDYVKSYTASTVTLATSVTGDGD